MASTSCMGEAVATGSKPAVLSEETSPTCNVSVTLRLLKDEPSATHWIPQ